jgi:hypothetical protein
MIMRANFPNVQRLSFTNKFVRTPQLARNSLSLNEVKLLFLSEWRYIQLLWLSNNDVMKMMQQIIPIISWEF